MRHVLLVFLAGVCFLAAVLSFPLPLPVGFLFFLAGVALLLAASPAARHRFAAFRNGNPRFDARIRAVEKYLPPAIRRALNGGPPPAGSA